MAKKYRFMVETRINGSIVREVSDDEDVDQVADEIASETPSYEDMEASGFIVSVESEVDDYDELK